ncbi:MAG TPA: hypothetical protein VLX68_00005 [Chitinivibrionales bacterium]|nr:hypothetical protein [Chitinivibrionales bacterium]
MESTRSADTPKKLLPIFRQYGLEAMVNAYKNNMRFAGFRIKQALWYVLTGFRFYRFINEIVIGLKNMSSISMSQSAWDTLARVGFSLEAEWCFDKNQLKGYPVLFYANHPGYIEPFLCLAELKDFDPAVVATGWLQNISEPVSKRIIGIWDSKEATAEYVKKFKGVRRILETVWANILTYQVVKHLQGDVSIRKCSASRISAIREIIITLAACKPLFLFPSGGEAQKFWVGEDTSSFEKLLGIILERRNRNSGLGQIRFVPMVRRGSLRALFKSELWAPWHPITFFPRLLPRKPFKFIMKEFFSLGDLVKSHNNATEITKFLMKRLLF